MLQFTYVNKKKETVFETAVRGDMIYRWVNLEDPTEFFDVPWTFIGQQADAAQALGAGLTYANRYFLMKFFQIATSENDPDNFRSRQEQEANEALKKEQEKLDAELSPIKKAILEELNKVEDNKILQRSLATILTKMTGKSNPNAIKDVDTAQLVLEAIKSALAKNTSETTLTKQEVTDDAIVAKETQPTTKTETKKKEKNK